MHEISLTLPKKKFYTYILAHLIEEEKYESCAELTKVIKQIPKDEYLTIDNLLVYDDDDEE